MPTVMKLIASSSNEHHYPFFFRIFVCQRNRTSMNTTETNTTETLLKEYQSPNLRIISVQVENAVCGSPLPGGNEDIGYDGEW